MKLQIHSKGQSAMIDKLEKQKKIEIEQINKSVVTGEKRFKLIQQIVNKFNRLIKDTDQSLFIENRIAKTSY